MLGVLPSHCPFPPPHLISLVLSNASFQKGFCAFPDYNIVYQRHSYYFCEVFLALQANKPPFCTTAPPSAQNIGTRLHNYTCCAGPLHPPHDIKNADPQEQKPRFTHRMSLSTVHSSGGVLVATSPTHSSSKPNSFRYSGIFR